MGRRRRGRGWFNVLKYLGISSPAVLVATILSFLGHPTPAPLEGQGATSSVETLTIVQQVAAAFGWSVHPAGTCPDGKHAHGANPPLASKAPTPTAAKPNGVGQPITAPESSDKLLVAPFQIGNSQGAITVSRVPAADASATNGPPKPAGYQVTFGTRPATPPAPPAPPAPPEEKPKRVAEKPTLFPPFLRR